VLAVPPDAELCKRIFRFKIDPKRRLKFRKETIKPVIATNYSKSPTTALK